MMRNVCDADDGVAVEVDKDEEDHDPVAKRRRAVGTRSVDRETTDAADKCDRDDDEKDKTDGTARKGNGKDVTADTGVDADKAVTEDKHTDSPPDNPGLESTATAEGNNVQTTADYYDQNDKKTDTDVVKKDETNQDTSTKPMDLDDNGDTGNDDKKDAAEKDTKGSADGDEDNPPPQKKSGIKDADGGTPSSDPMTN